MHQQGLQSVQYIQNPLSAIQEKLPINKQRNSKKFSGRATEDGTISQDGDMQYVYRIEHQNPRI